jgi:outer membrane protein TolC
VSQVDGARLELAADVAEAFEGARVADQALVLQQTQVKELELVVDQAQRRFQQGESPSTDVDQARARLAESQAGLARAEGEVARAAARYRTLVGEEPVGLEPPGAGPAAPADLQETLTLARANNPQLAAASASVRAAEAAVRRARAEGLPSVALVAEASSIRDQFLPGYRADGGSIGIQGRWSPFSGGLVAGKVDEARANRRAAEAAYDESRATVEEGAINAWQGLRTADAVAVAARAQTRAADAALDSVRNEVRVGVKPVLDLLDAEREALAARVGDLRAQGARIVAAYRLKAVIGQ